MSCDPVSLAAFRAMKPQFSEVSDQITQSYIDLAQIWIPDDWVDPVCQSAQIAVTCHLMTIDGLGSDKRSRDFLSGRSDYQTVKSGSVTLTRFRSAAESAGMSTSQWFAQTPCGQQYLVFVRMLSSGARWVGGSSPAPVSGYARDGWWLC